MMDAALFIAGVIVIVFARELIARWWKQREWRRRWRRDAEK
jgi:hypothetical protein